MNYKKILLLLYIPLLAACVNAKVIDDLTIVTAGGIDHQNDEMIFIVTSPRFYSESEIIDVHQTLHIPKKGNIFEHLNRQSSRPILMGDMDAFLLGKNIAEAGIFPVMDTLQRNPNIGSRLLLAITEDPLEEFMTAQYGSNGNAIYITNLLEQNTNYRDLPRSNVHLFASNFFQNDIDAYLPVLKQIDKDTDQTKLEISGMGIFRNDKLVDILPAEKLFTFKYLVDRHTNGSTSVIVGKHNAVVSSIHSKKAKIKTDLKKETLHIQFNSKGVVESYSGEKVDNKTLDKIKKAYNKQLENETLTILNHFRELNIDPVGIQRKFRQQHRNFNPEKWDELQKNLKIIVDSDITITESGTLE